MGGCVTLVSSLIIGKLRGTMNLSKAAILFDKLYRVLAYDTVHKFV